MVRAEHQKILVNTFSYERVERHPTVALEEKLAPYAATNPMHPEQTFEKFAERVRHTERPRAERRRSGIRRV